MGIQRARILGALAEVCVECGAPGLTVARVVERAGVSRRTFYELFDDCEDCFLIAFDHGIECVTERVTTAYRSENTWRTRIRAGLSALLNFLDEEPYTARLLVIESLSIGPVGLQRRTPILTKLVNTIEQGHPQTKTGVKTAPLTAEGIVGATLSIIHARMLNNDDHECLLGLLNPLMSMIVLPYLGRNAARHELECSTPKPSTNGTTPANPLKGLGMRLTYRTVRVLITIAANPGSSNRLIGETAGVTDQGQISKLLTRLAKRGLIQNTGAGQTRGEPNAWTLTKHGQEIHTIITNHTTTT
jgi:AcrR family transcriptional regulator